MLRSHPHANVLRSKIHNNSFVMCFSVEGNNLSPEKNEPVDELKLRTQLYLNCITLQSTVWFQIPLMCVQCLLRAAAAGSLSGSEWHANTRELNPSILHTSKWEKCVVFQNVPVGARVINKVGWDKKCTMRPCSGCPECSAEGKTETLFYTPERVSPRKRWPMLCKWTPQILISYLPTAYVYPMAVIR